MLAKYIRRKHKNCIFNVLYIFLSLSKYSKINFVCACVCIIAYKTEIWLSVAEIIKNKYILNVLTDSG